MELKCIGSGSKGNAYALVEKDEILLLECGMPLITVKEAIGWKISNVVGCLISHIHKDHAGHVKGRDSCIYECGNGGKYRKRLA